MRVSWESPPDEIYRWFAEQETRESPCFREWALGAADDPDVLALVETLPLVKRQPTLVFAAARWLGAQVGPYEGLRRVLLEQWPDVEATVMSRATQTNEVGRCATMLPLLASLPGPLALLEVGCSAGLCLLPDRYSYRYTGSQGTQQIDPAGGPSPVVLDCRLEGDVPLDDLVSGGLPEIVWRGGLDLNPLDVQDDDAMRWLQTLVWPEHDDRRARLAAAVDVARADPPTLVRGDLLVDLPALVAQVPADATLVVFHSAVLAYLSEADRSRFAETVAATRGHWLSNEGPLVVPGIEPPPRPPDSSAVSASTFLLSLDQTPVAWTHGHGRAARCLDDRSQGRSPDCDSPHPAGCVVVDSTMLGIAFAPPPCQPRADEPLADRRPWNRYLGCPP